MTTLSDVLEEQQAKNLELKSREARVLLRQRIYDRIFLTVCSTPIQQIEAHINGLTDWILNLIGSESKSGGIFGLSPNQIFHLKAFYESRTGKKAEDI